MLRATMTDMKNLCICFSLFFTGCSYTLISTHKLNDLQFDLEIYENSYKEVDEANAILKKDNAFLRKHQCAEPVFLFHDDMPMIQPDPFFKDDMPVDAPHTLLFRDNMPVITDPYVNISTPVVYISVSTTVKKVPLSTLGGTAQDK